MALLNKKNPLKTSGFCMNGAEIIFVKLFKILQFISVCNPILQTLSYDLSIREPWLSF
jgi:hypothetical protein